MDRKTVFAPGTPVANEADESSEILFPTTYYSDMKENRESFRGRQSEGPVIAETDSEDDEIDYDLYDEKENEGEMRSKNYPRSSDTHPLKDALRNISGIPQVSTDQDAAEGNKPGSRHVSSTSPLENDDDDSFVVPLRKTVGCRADSVPDDGKKTWGTVEGGRVAPDSDSDDSFVGAGKRRVVRRVLDSDDEDDVKTEPSLMKKDWRSPRPRADSSDGDDDDDGSGNIEASEDEERVPGIQGFDDTEDEVVAVGEFTKANRRADDTVNLDDSYGDEDREEHAVDDEWDPQADARAESVVRGIQDFLEKSGLLSDDSCSEDDVARGDASYVEKVGTARLPAADDLSHQSKLPVKPPAAVPVSHSVSSSGDVRKAELKEDPAVELESLVTYIEKQENLLKMTGAMLPDKGCKLRLKIESLKGRQAVLEKEVAALKKEQRRKERGYEVEDEFLDSASSSLGATAAPPRNSADKYAGIEAQPLVPAFSRSTVTLDPQAVFAKVGPQKKVLEHMFAADPNQNKLFGGRMNDARHMEVKTVTHDSLYGLHESLKSMPREDDPDTLVEPKRLKAPLMLHQRRAVTWGLWRETQNPPGGILADDMGLGKTYTMIALAIKAGELEREAADRRKYDDDSSDDDRGIKWLDAKALKKAGLKKSDATLIVCPASCIGQWENEVKSKVGRHPRVVQYHGASRKKASPRSLAYEDFVITTYKTIQSEFFPRRGGESDSPLLKIAWNRVILDEAHVIRNPKSQTAEALCKLRAGRRWCLTGTPIHNKELDMYSLLKFMRMAPFDELEVWKRFVDNNSQAGTKRLNLVVKAILLRRTKDQVDPATGKTLVTLPPRSEKLHTLTLNESERRVHDKIMDFSRNALSSFLMKTDNVDGLERIAAAMGNAPAESRRGGPMMRLAKTSDVKVTAILVLLLRLRQICCHPNLLWSILDDADVEAEAYGAAAVDRSIEDEMMAGLKQLSLNDNDDDPDAEARRFFRKDNPLFDTKTVSTKIAALLAAVKEVPEGDKVVVVSQWTSMLEIVGIHLKQNRIRTVKLTGNVPVQDRIDIVNSFNSPSSPVKVLLLSLGAGGVGLNLVGGNHLFLVDVHWNPQLESQACDRIYRVGQTKPVFIHRFVCEQTVEEKIRAVQQKKLALAESVLTGARRAGNQKLTIQDLIELFSN